MAPPVPTSAALKSPKRSIRLRRSPGRFESFPGADFAAAEDVVAGNVEVGPPSVVTDESVSESVAVMVVAAVVVVVLEVVVVASVMAGPSGPVAGSGG